MSFRADLLANAADNQEPFTIVVHNLRSPCEWGFGRSFRAKRLTANVFVDGLSLITNQWLPATGVHQCEWLWPIWLRKTRIFPQKIKDYKKQKQRKAQFSDDAWLLFIFELFPLFSVLKSPNCVVLLIRSKSTTIFIREMYNNSVFVSIFGGKRNYFWHHSHRADCSYSTTVTKNRPSQTHVHLHSGYFPNIPLPRNEWTSHWILMNFMANQWKKKNKTKPSSAPPKNKSPPPTKNHSDKRNHCQTGRDLHCGCQNQFLLIIIIIIILTTDRQWRSAFVAVKIRSSVLSCEMRGGVQSAVEKWLFYSHGAPNQRTNPRSCRASVQDYRGG